MQLNKLAGLMIAASICLPTFAMAETVATVNGVAIDKTEVDQQVLNIISSTNGQAQDTPALREQVKNHLIDQQVIIQEAKHRNLDKTPDFARRLNDATNDLLQSALFNDIVTQKPITEVDIQQRYKEIAEQFAKADDVHAVQIVVDTQEEANKVIGYMKRGLTIDKLEKALQADSTIKAQMTNMGWVNLNFTNTQLADILKPMKAGQFTQSAYASNNRWFMFKVLERRPGQAPAYDQIKQQIFHELQEKEITQTVSDLRAKAQISN